MNEFKPNSHKYRAAENEKHFQKVVSNARRSSGLHGGTYTNYSRGNVVDITDYQSPRFSGPVYKRIVLETREDAEEVLDNLSNAIDEFGVVSISDLYEFVGIKSEYTDNKYGWTNISSAKAIPVSDGYLLKLPKAILI